MTELKIRAMAQRASYAAVRRAWVEAYTSALTLEKELDRELRTLRKVELDLAKEEGRYLVIPTGHGRCCPKSEARVRPEALTELASQLTREALLALITQLTEEAERVEPVAAVKKVEAGEELRCASRGRCV